MEPGETTNSSVQILIAEDSPTQAARLAHLLEQHGYGVTTATNGREALALLDRCRPTLIISDVLMPELDGYGLCKAIKATEKWKDIPVMLVTSLSDALDVVRGLECGADNFIRKPYHEKYLLSRVEYLLMNLELRKNQKMQMGLEINLGGQRHFITSERQQILDLLISTYEQAVNINDELKTRERDLAHANQVLSGLYRIAGGLNQAGSEREVAELALARALELPGIQAGWISLREGESGFRLAAARNLPPALEAPGVMEGDCACRRRLISGELDSATNILECERLQKATGDTRGLLYHASVPLYLGDRTLGVMNLVGPEKGLFNEEELNVLNSVGNQFAVALERARLRDHLEKLVEERTARIVRLNRVYSVLSGINTTIVRARKRQQLFEEACRIAVEQGKFTFAWIGMLDAGTREVTPVARAGRDEGYLSQIHSSASEGTPGNSELLAHTLTHGVPVVCNDIASDERMKVWRAEAIKRGYRSMALFPLGLDGSPMGVFVLYAPEPNVFDEEEMNLLVEMAGDISFALDHIRKEEMLTQQTAALTEEIAERKVIEQELVQSHDLLELTGRIARIGGWQIDVDTQTLSWTEEVYRIHEVDPAVRLNVPEAIEFYAPEARPAISAAVSACIDAGAPWDLELPLITAKGRRIWVRAQGAAVRQDGRTVRLHGAFQDITERKQATDAILREKVFSEAMLECLPGILLLFDHTGRFLRWNHSLEIVSGYSAEEVAEMRPLDFFPEEDRTWIEETIGKVFETGAAEAEVTVLAKDGRKIPFYFVGARIAVEGVPCFLVTGIDLTARRQLEMQLRQSQKIEAIGQLAGGIAHDFNNILSVIMIFGELALRQLEPGHPVRARVEKMMKGAEQAAGLTRQLLAFSRKQVIQPKLLDLNHLVADTHKMLGRLIGENIDVIVRPAPGLGTVKADAGQIEQIIMNLAVNARDAMPKGGSLTLETANVDLGEEYAATHPDTKPGRYVLLAVSDTGIGMDEATQARIFEPFFTTKPEGQGTGLGLSTVYGIVKQSGGGIQVYSEPGRGATFKVYLPRVDEACVAASPAVPQPIAPRGHETVLLVEDNETLREVIRDTLEGSGYTVLTALNGEEGLAQAREHKGPIDLLLTDVVMPKLGGGDLANQLSGLRPGIRVLFMSGYTDGAIAQQGVLMEGATLLEKPFTAEKLVRAVSEALSRPIENGQRP